MCLPTRITVYQYPSTGGLTSAQNSANQGRKMVENANDKRGLFIIHQRLCVCVCARMGVDIWIVERNRYFL